MLLDIDPTYARGDWTYSDTPRTVEEGKYFCYPFDVDPVHLTSPVEATIPHYPFVRSPNTTAPNFWDIIKDQVHVFPTLSVDFGLVLSQQEMEYYIWNSYVDKSVTVQDPVLVGDYGTSFVIDYAGPFTLLAGQGVPALLTVYVEGPISSATDFHLETQVESEDPYTYVIKTKATRIIVFPFWPDWSKDVSVMMKFHTGIAKNKHKLEQRRPLLPKPQRSISFSNFETLYGLTHNAINFAKDKTVGIIIPHEVFNIETIESDGVTMVESPSEFWNLKRYCDYILVFERFSGKLVAKKITSISGNKIYIENPILEDFISMPKLVGFPMITGVFKTAKSKVLNGNLVSWDLSFEELRGENQPALTGVPSMPSTLDIPFDWSKDVGYSVPIYRDIGEFTGTAQMIYAKYPLTKNPLNSFTGKFYFGSRSELFSFCDFICAAKGRFKKFDFLFELSEFQLIRGEYEGVTQLRIKNNFYAEQFSKMLNKKIVLIYHDNVLNTSIVSVSTNADYTTITMANPTTFRIYDEDCHMVRIEQWKTVRFDLDEFKITCKSGLNFEVDIRLMEVYE